ncbi:hypothetical protein ACEWK1_11310 [Metabacillus sp. YM-086]|uniref:hypothetical protein n=1 Tax=Metabacillus sp. YM-086 TaxID=3341729 RepID=UPI003A8A41BC
MNITFATKEDAQGIIELDKKIFPNEWIVEESFIKTIIDKNPYCYRIIKEFGTIIGFCCFIPLKKENYDQLLIGEIKEKDLPNYVEKYDKQTNFYIYFATINIDQSNTKKSKYTRYLFIDVKNQITNYINDGIKVKEVAAITITKEGERLVKNKGFDYSHKLDGDSVYRYNKF